MKTIDSDTHYWPVDFLDQVNHADKNAADLFGLADVA